MTASIPHESGGERVVVGAPSPVFPGPRARGRSRDRRGPGVQPPSDKTVDYQAKYGLRFSYMHPYTPLLSAERV